MIKVWSACARHLSHSIRRVVQHLMLYRPDWAQYVRDRDDADVVIDHAVDNNWLPIRDDQQHVFWQYTYETSPTTREEWEVAWERALMVASYLPLPTDRLHLTPLGAAPNVFGPMASAKKRYGYLATGYVADSECIDLAYQACVEVGLPLMHVGGDLKLGPPDKYVNVEGITDLELCTLYNESYLALATRKEEGFELPAVEAAMCGVPAVMLDLPCYRRWFDGLVFWAAPNNTWQEMIRLLWQASQSNHPGHELARPLIGERLRAEAIDRFSWRPIIENFWDVLEARIRASHALDSLL